MKYRKKGFDYTLLDQNTIQLPEDISPIAWKNVFNNTNPIVVEIGCGNGHFLTDTAAKDPSRNFIGIDLKDYRIVKSRMKEINLNLKNTSWICGEAFKSIERMFDDESIEMIYMTFPDPWPKTKHHKHRLFKKDFIDLLSKKLQKNGKFLFITDHEDYYNWCIDLLKDEKRFKIIGNEYNQNLTNSAFGMIWKNENRDFHSFTMEKIAFLDS